MPLQANNPAPDFTLPDENGMARSLAEFRGEPVVLYFYPKDDTPGCTTEACNFRNDYSVYANNGVVILGVSPDTSKSHTKFKAKYNLPFTLLSDEDHVVCEAYGVWVLKQMYGREYYGVARTTFLIDGEGQIVKVFEKVSPKGHSGEILAVL